MGGWGQCNRLVGPCLWCIKAFLCIECIDIHIKCTSCPERQLSLAVTRVLCGCVQDALRDHRAVDGGSSNTNSTEEQQPGRGDDQLITPSDSAHLYAGELTLVSASGVSLLEQVDQSAVGRAECSS